jgi:serine/threonine-protein kinase
MDTPAQLTERYRLDSHLARGGMADVYQGHDTLLGRKVAVKVLHSQLSADDAFVKRFRREAQAAANLTHPNIVGIYDWGQQDSTYFIVMELVDGRSLREVLKSEGALLPRRAVEIAAEVAAALSVAHRSGLVHRDIKPGNILLAPDGTVKVTDFGIARAWDDSSELTRTGAVMGTATYFSPEQAQGVPADERSDVYSLGVVLYEMLTGRPPFRGDSPVSVAYQHVSSEVASPSALNPDVPPELDAIVLKAMHKEPGLRYQTAEELRTDLWRSLQGQTPAAAGVHLEEAPTRMMPAAGPPPATVPPDEAYRQLEEPPSSNLAFLFGTFVLLATLGVLVFLVLRLLGGTGGGDQEVAVPDVAGQTEVEALRQIQAAGLIALPQRQADPAVPAGQVIRTDPAGGATAARGDTVLVFVSLGAEQFSVPFLLGLEQTAAEDLIRRQGFTVGVITTQEAQGQVEPGTVVAQTPGPGSPAPAGSAIDLVVATGPETVVLEPLENLTEGEATAKLDALGLVWEVAREFSAEVEKGRVIRTEPPAGTEASAGDVITLVISDGPPPQPVPDLRGLTEAEARAAVEALGLVLEVAVARLEVTDPALVDRVVDQFPTAGVTLEGGGIVTVTLGAAPITTTTTLPPDTTTTVGG